MRSQFSMNTVTVVKASIHNLIVGLIATVSFINTMLRNRQVGSGLGIKFGTTRCQLMVPTLHESLF